jgi:hypothetical protein
MFALALLARNTSQKRKNAANPKPKAHRTRVLKRTWEAAWIVRRRPANTAASVDGSPLMCTTMRPWVGVVCIVCR